MPVIEINKEIKLKNLLTGDDKEAKAYQQNILDRIKSLMKRSQTLLLRSKNNAFAQELRRELNELLSMNNGKSPVIFVDIALCTVRAVSNSHQ